MPRDKAHQSAYNREYRLKHRDEILAKQKAYRVANADRIAARRLEILRENPEQRRKANERSYRHAARHPERRKQQAREGAARYRARKKARLKAAELVTRATAAARQALLDRQRGFSGQLNLARI